MTEIQSEKLEEVEDQGQDLETGGVPGVDLEVEVEDVPIPDPTVETEDEETQEVQREEGLAQETDLDQDLIQSLVQDREIE